jgi:uncharacterized protein
MKATESEPVIAKKTSTGSQITLVDADVHPSFSQPWPDELAPYLSPAWQFKFRGGEAYRSRFGKEWSGLAFTIPFNGSYPRTGSPVRTDLITSDEPVPATDPKRSAVELLDRYGIDRAILITQSVIGIGAMPNWEAAAQIAAASNDWLVDRWLTHDSRWRGTITVAAQDPQGAAAEIERHAADRRFVAVFISPGSVLLGDRTYFPIYAAAERLGLAVMLHVTGTEGLAPTGPPLAGGTPTYHFVWRMNYAHPYQAYLASMIGNGVFETFPKLRVVFTEMGFAWLPDLMWRMDSFWKSAREDTPWIKRPPSEYVKAHCRFTTQPFIEPAHRRHTAQILDMIDARRTLMFSTDYPHWDFDEPLRISQELPAEVRQAVLAQNAIATFGDRLL